MTIVWSRFSTRPANEQDVKECGVELGEEVDFEEEIRLPAKYVVCSRCEGKGTHVNPSIDGHGITAEEWNGPDWSEEDKENYLTGFYDVACYECSGKRVTLAVDEDACDKKLYEEYVNYLDEKAKEDYADRRMRWAEDGGYGSMDDY